MTSFNRFETYTRCPLQLNLAEVSDEALDQFLLEKYIDNSLHHQTSSLSLKSLVRAAYYKLRPLFPVWFRKHLQRVALKGWENIPFPSWPLDTSVDDRVAEGFKHLLNQEGCDRVPFIWFWPHGHRYAAIMTHDVETAVGRDFTARMMEMEARHGIHSAFEIVPEERYEVPESYLESIRSGGCEVCLHGLNHDGHLFDNPVEFAKRANKIQAYAQQFQASGFRSPIMYRDLEWLPELAITHDMSVPNTGHLDPQRGGCCTVMPYFIGDVLELPLTTIQDYPLYNILQDYSLNLWRKQEAIVRSRFGLLSFIVHPDYTTSEEASNLYAELLAWLADLRDHEGLWMTLPREIDQWWRRRARMQVTGCSGEWAISGEDTEGAVLAYASLRDGKLLFELDTGTTYKM